MIKQEDRDKLKKMMIRGDIARAKTIYRVNTGRIISEKTLQKFISGERKNLGLDPAAHQPAEMYKSLAQAVSERHDREKRLNTLAADILASTIEATQSAAVY